MKVFVSYRRSDTAQIAGRIFDQLVATYGRESVFKDVDSIALGSDFRSAIEEAISRCDVIIVLIGKNWLDTADAGARRLDDPTDLVRLEIEGAFGKQLRVIPLLVDGAKMPVSGALPASLTELAFRNAAIVRSDPDFHRDMERVIRAIGAPSAQTLKQAAGSRSDENWHPLLQSGFQLRVLSGPMAETTFPLGR